MEQHTNNPKDQSYQDDYLASNHGEQCEDCREYMEHQQEIWKQLRAAGVWDSPEDPATAHCDEVDLTVYRSK